MSLYYKPENSSIVKIRDYMTTGIYCGVPNTNVITSIPRDINISVSNGIVTLKKGSKVYFPNGYNNGTGFWCNMNVKNGAAYFFNDNCWGRVNKKFNIGTGDFEFVGKIKLTSAPTKEYADIYAKNYILALSVKNDLSIHCNCGNGVNTWGNDITSSANLLQLNKIYWVKTERKNNVITLSYSEDGINYTSVGTRNSTQSVPSANMFWIGKDKERSNIYFPGNVYMDGCYAKINGEFLWKGSDGYGAKFEEYIAPEDKTMGTVGSVSATGDILYLTADKQLAPYGTAFVTSSSVTVPTTQYAFWYDMGTNLIKYTSDAGSTWYSGHSFPLCLMNRTNGTVTAITQVHNGFGYIGYVMFALPRVSGLIPNGKNPDGTYNSWEYVNDSVRTEDWGPQGGTGSVTYAIGPDYFRDSGPGYELQNGYLIDKYNNSKVNAFVWGTGSRTDGKINQITVKPVGSHTIVAGIGFIYQNGKLLYKGRHYEAWTLPRNCLSLGYSCTGEASSQLARLFDGNTDTRWGQGVQGNRKWFRLTLPFPVIVESITVAQGYTGTHSDSKTYNVTFYAELTGANSNGGQIQISNKTTLNWDTQSLTNIPLTNKPICKQVYCWCEGQAYGTLGEVYMSGRRVL